MVGFMNNVDFDGSNESWKVLVLLFFSCLACF